MQTSTGPGLVTLLSLSWRNGGGREKAFASMMFFYPVQFVFLLLVVGALISTQTWPPFILVPLLVSALAFPPFQQAFFVPLFTPAAIRQGLEIGLGRTRPEYYSELARYIDTFGTRGHLRGDIFWGAVFWIIAYAKLYGGVAATLLFASMFGITVAIAYAAADGGVSILLRLLYGLRVRGWKREAERRGFRLLRKRLEG